MVFKLSDSFFIFLSSVVSVDDGYSKKSNLNGYKFSHNAKGKINYD